MEYLKKLPNSVREVPGLEWTVMKKLPLALVLGTLFPLVMGLANRFFPPEGAATQIAKHIKSMDILAIATAVTVWTAVLTVAIGCFVMMMKGRAYIADAYELEDSERPRSRGWFVSGWTGDDHPWPLCMLRCREISLMQDQCLPETL